jgi:GNAT superfamily N-acetyltransferase
MVDITTLRPDDRARWSELWAGYLDFYETSLPAERFARTWEKVMAGDELFALGARRDGALVGITHYLFHASTWMDRVCYLQDLFVDPIARGGGVGRALIEAVAEQARAGSCGRLYWTTQTGNTAGRALYDKLARFNGFIRYDYAWPEA